MWILWSILGVIGVAIAVALLLPIHLIIQNDENNNLLFCYRVLGKTYGQIPKPESSVVKSLKKNTGITRAQERMSRKKLWEDTVQTVKELCDILSDLLGELVGVLRHCTAKVFQVRVICASENAAETAIAFGGVSALVYGFGAVAENLMHIRKKGRDLYVSCDFENGHKEFRYHFEIRVRVYALLPVLLRLVLKESKKNKNDK